MDDFLLDAPKSNYACNSIEDLQQQLSVLRQVKVSESKAEHISATFEFRPNAVFHVLENENDGADAGQNIDLVPARSSAVTPDAVASDNGLARPAPPDEPVSRATREIRAQDALLNQPADDPTLQKAVAKLIITCLGAADDSNWMVRSVSRGPSGWTFQYICRNSRQAWQRQNSKTAAKVLVGGSSGQDGQDPVNLARPAFDCRGSVIVAFARNSRLITVKLDHTPFHKTVADLLELYKPPPPPARTEQARRKTGNGKKRKTPALEAAEAGAEAVNGETVEGPSQAKKKRKKSVNPDDQAVQDQQKAKPKKSRKSSAKNTAQHDDANGQQDLALLNLSPSEAARRRDQAVRKLAEHGIDAKTLSAEQFDIFANQSPDLQNESLAMLVRYGAERLRIVHPNKDDGSSAPSSAEPAAVAGSTPMRKNTRKPRLNEDGTPKMKRTRGSCQACRDNKRKCSKAKPECTECVEAGVACYYPPQKTRKSLNKSAEVVELESEELSETVPTTEHAEIAGGETVQPEAVMVEEPDSARLAEEEASDLGSPGFDSQPANTTSALANVSHDAYQPTFTGLSYPQGATDATSTGMDYSAYSGQALQQENTQSGAAYAQKTQQMASSDYTGSAETQSAAIPVQEPPETVQPTSQPFRAKKTRSNARVNLPSGPNFNHDGVKDSAKSNDRSWRTTDTPPNEAQRYVVSPPRQQQPAEGTQAHSMAFEASQHDGLQAAMTLTQAAMQKAQSSPGKRTVSPFQNPSQTSRTKSRGSQRGQNHAAASPFRQAPSTQSAPIDASTIYNSSASSDPQTVSDYNPYSRYGMATPTVTQKASRSAQTYQPYSQQTTSGNSAASYPVHDGLNARPQSSAPPPVAAPANKAKPASSKNAAPPTSTSWAHNAASRSRSRTTYNNSNLADASNPTYGMSSSSNHQQLEQQQQQQQPTAMRSFNGRPQPASHNTRSTASSTYGMQQQAHNSGPQQSYADYSSQHQSTPSHQAQPQPPQHQAHQDWYGFGSASNVASGYGSESRGAGYGQPGAGTNGYNQHRAMNLSGNTYQSMNDQELYEMLRNNSSH